VFRRARRWCASSTPDIRRTSVLILENLETNDDLWVYRRRCA
jgi:hypothetical protein